MKKPITPFVHGLLDYATVAATAAAPAFIRMSAPAEAALRSLAAGYLGLSLLTDYPLGLARKAPFKAHGMAEVALAVGLPLLPQVFGFAKDRNARRWLLGLTAATFVIAPLTQWRRR